MRWLIRPRHDEHGAVIVLVMVVMVAIIAMAALVIDIGALQDEKGQLQNGADAGAIGVAQSCVPGPIPSCDASLAAALVNGNARDNDSKSSVDDYRLTPGFVTVHTSTKAGSSNLVPFQFGQLLTGVKGKGLTATAVARWGGIRRTSVIPLTISKCEFDRATSNNTVFDVPTVVLFKTKAPSCTVNGADLPGGFGWVKDATPGDCSVTPSAGDIIGDDTGVVGTPNGCDIASLLGKDVSLVVYNAVAGTGTNGTYAIYGFGNFHLTGYRFASKSGGVVPCASPDSCIAGYFVKTVGVAGTDQYGGPSLAGNLVTLIK